MSDIVLPDPDWGIGDDERRRRLSAWMTAVGKRLDREKPGWRERLRTPVEGERKAP